MDASIKLYSLTYGEIRTWLWAALFVACNIALPQLFHLIPQGGIVFAPLSLVVLAGAYKFGWRVGLLAAVASPLVNHTLFGQPAWDVLQVMVGKLAVLAMAAGLTAQYFRRVSLLLIVGVVIAAEAVGLLAELALKGGFDATAQDFTIGWPGLLLQVFGTYALLKLWTK